MSMSQTRKKYTWFYNGIKVTRRWLEFNYGKALINEFQQQADVYFESVGNKGLYSFNNGISVTCQ